jgi:hypothetical protein
MIPDWPTEKGILLRQSENMVHRKLIPHWLTEYEVMLRQ